MIKLSEQEARGGGIGEREKERNRSEGLKTESDGAAERTPIRNKAVD